MEAIPELEKPQDLPVYNESTVQDSLVKSFVPYIAVLFTAHYCPPCHAFMEQFKAFCAEANKEQKKFNVVVVSADQREEAYQALLADIPEDWSAIPFGADD